MIQWLKDLWLEVLIEVACQRILNAPRPDDQRRHALEMGRLIAMRSPGQVARMERRQGLS